MALGLDVRADRGEERAVETFWMLEATIVVVWRCAM